MPLLGAAHQFSPRPPAGGPGAGAFKQRIPSVSLMSQPPLVVVLSSDSSGDVVSSPCLWRS